jgi:hypothetical protein
MVVGGSTTTDGAASTAGVSEAAMSPGSEGGADEEFDGSDSPIPNSALPVAARTPTCVVIESISCLFHSLTGLGWP